MKYLSALLVTLFLLNETSKAQLYDDFEGNGNISSWFGDACVINLQFNNPLINSSNNSAKVLEYDDQGGQYANVRFDAGYNFDLARNSVFTLKIYVPSAGITGNQTNQISLKLQDGSSGTPWTTQTEIIKPLLLNQWQSISFDFANDPYTNYNSGSPAPILRNDLSRVLIQINGENNSDLVKAYIDDFYFFDSLPPAPVFNQLVWSDEFNGTGALDTSKWFHQTQLPLNGSWYNGEIQHYTNRTANTFMSNGYLNLVAKKETFSDQGHTKQYTSARLNSKYTFQYGRIEVRAQLPTGNGTWPAIWTLGKNIIEPGAYWTLQGYGTAAWPACGEIDIMEHWGNNQNFVQSAMHTPSSHGGTINKGGQVVSTASTAFHVYALEWTQNKMVFSVDSVVHYTYNPSVKDPNTWPFDAEQFLLLNIAIQSGIDPTFTQSSMLVDYVRIYQQSTVGLEEKSENAAPEIYPNPVKDELFIELTEALKTPVVLNFYNIEGRLILQKQAAAGQEKLRIENLSDLPRGMYFLNYTADSRQHSFKFIKQ